MTYSIKFQFEINLINNETLDNIFKKIGQILNIQLDKNLKPYIHNNKVDYEIVDVSQLDQEHIESKINSFFFHLILHKPLMYHCINSWF